MVVNFLLSNRRQNEAKTHKKGKMENADEWECEKTPIMTKHRAMGMRGMTTATTTTTRMSYSNKLNTYFNF